MRSLVGEGRHYYGTTYEGTTLGSRSELDFRILPWNIHRSKQSVITEVCASKVKCLGTQATYT